MKNEGTEEWIEGSLRRTHPCISSREGNRYGRTPRQSEAATSNPRRVGARGLQHGPTADEDGPALHRSAATKSRRDRLSFYDNFAGLGAVGDV